MLFVVCSVEEDPSVWFWALTALVCGVDTASGHSGVRRSTPHRSKGLTTLPHLHCRPAPVQHVFPWHPQSVTTSVESGGRSRCVPDHQSLKRWRHFPLIRDRTVWLCSMKVKDYSTLSKSQVNLDFGFPTTFQNICQNFPLEQLGLVGSDIETNFSTGKIGQNVQLHNFNKTY